MMYLKKNSQKKLLNCKLLLEELVLVKLLTAVKEVVIWNFK